MRLAWIISILILLMPSCDYRGKWRSQFHCQDWLPIAFGHDLPVPLSEIRGMGDAWESSFNCYFHLHCQPEEMVAFLKKNGFKESDVHLEEIRFNLPPGMEKYFTPAWQPKWTKHSKVYLREFGSICSTSVMLDFSTGEIYAHSSGHSNEFPRN